MAREFHDHGFLFIPKALTREQLLALNQAVDNDLHQHGA
jgi:hypothetical protein